MHLIDVAKQQGFKQTIGTHPNFSTAVSNGVRTLFEHQDGRQFCWGLNEHGKPPTLIWPRPKIKTDIDIYDESGNFLYTIKGNEQFDDAMNKCLQKISHEEILKEMFSLTGSVFNI